MIFLVAMPALFGFANYFVPLQIGARDMAFPAAQRVQLLAVPLRRRSAVFQHPGGRCAGRRLVQLRAAQREALLLASRGWITGRWRLLVIGIGTVGTAINFMVTVAHPARAGHDACDGCRSSPG